MQLVKRLEIPGISIAAVRGEEYRCLVYGVKSVHTWNPITPVTVFEAASLGKPVFAYAVLNCAKPVCSTYEPLYNYVDPIYVEEKFLMGSPVPDGFSAITARMVLSHTSGLPNWRPGTALLPVWKPGEGPLHLKFAPGTSSCYSGEGYTYLQKVIEYLVKLSVENTGGLC